LREGDDTSSWAVAVLNTQQFADSSVIISLARTQCKPMPIQNLTDQPASVALSFMGQPPQPLAGIVQAKIKAAKNASSLLNETFQGTVGKAILDEPYIRCRDVNVYYGEKQALQNVHLDIGRNEVIAFIGPSGCGKSTLLRCLNRMNNINSGLLGYG